ncbi:MAG: hypothetical protein WC539_01695 [Nitrospirota bacterium]
MVEKPQGKKLDTVSTGLGMAFFIASLFNALLIIVKENNPALKEWMQSLFGHHWTTHGIFVIIFFIIGEYLLSISPLAKKIDGSKTSLFVIGGTVFGGLIITGFYVKHLFE